MITLKLLNANWPRQIVNVALKLSSPFQQYGRWPTSFSHIWMWTLTVYYWLTARCLGLGHFHSSTGFTLVRMRSITHTDGSEQEVSVILLRGLVLEYPIHTDKLWYTSYTLTNSNHSIKHAIHCVLCQYIWKINNQFQYA